MYTLYIYCQMCDIFCKTSSAAKRMRMGPKVSGLTYKSRAI